MFFSYQAKISLQKKTIEKLNIFSNNRNISYAILVLPIVMLSISFNIWPYDTLKEKD